MRVGGEVDDAGIDGAFLVIFRILANVQGRDADIVAALTDAMVNDLQSFVLEFAQVARRAVAEEMNFRIVFVADEGVGQFEGLGQARGGIGHLAVLERASEGRLVGGRRLLDLSVARSQQNEHLLLVLQAVHQFERVGASLFKAGRAFVGALHRSGGIEDNNSQSAGGDVPGEIRTAQGQDRQQKQEQLEDEQPVMAEPLERGVGLRFGKELLPEQCAGNQLDNAAAFQQVKHDHHRQSGGEPKRGWRQEPHGRGKG